MEDRPPSEAELVRRAREAAMGWTASAAPIVGVSLAALLLIVAAGWIARRVPHTAVQGTEPLAR